VQVRRSRLLGVLDAFDLPALEPNCASRNVSTVAPQSLMLMNSDFVLTSSRQLAERFSNESYADPAETIRFAWRLLFSRVPTDAEIKSALQFIEDEQVRLSETAETVKDAKQPLNPILWSWATFCQALFGSNEFLYVD
jgi:hypothetical protein